MNLNQVLILLLQLMTMTKVSELSGETKISQNFQLEVHPSSVTFRELNYNRENFW